MTKSLKLLYIDIAFHMTYLENMDLTDLKT